MLVDFLDVGGRDWEESETEAVEFLRALLA